MTKSYSIMSYDTLCLEINGGEKTQKNIEAGEIKKESSSHYVDTPSSQLSVKIKGVYFDDLDYVTFDPINDPEPASCFNCWQQGHSRNKCSIPKSQNFCYNCGRRNVRIIDCPRCSRACVSYWKLRKESSRLISELYDDHSATSLKMEENKKMGKDTKLDQLIVTDENECTSSNESGYFEDMVVDENVRSKKFTGKFLEDFLNLMDAMKHLPIDTQNFIILRFVEDRRNMIEEEGSMIIRIPSLYKIWNSRRVLLNYFYKFGRDLLSLLMQVRK